MTSHEALFLDFMLKIKVLSKYEDDEDLVTLMHIYTTKEEIMLNYKALLSKLWVGELGRKIEDFDAWAKKQDVPFDLDEEE